jgi:phosphoglycolate phosphatase-like HAD superfamily hydrolase
MTDRHAYTRDSLAALSPRHSSFVGVDSDGCVFDTMEIKQKKCFHPLIVSHWKLEPLEKYVREAAEFVNLYSKWRGTNRFLALIRMFDLLRERGEVVKSGVKIPELKALRTFVASGAALGNPEIEKNVNETGNSEMASILEWSRAVNLRIEQTFKHVPPFKWVRESLEKISGSSDMICVSQTPTEALVREWKENNLMKYPAVIAGQELGTKTEHIALASKNKYDPCRILIIGDAFGDRKAAEENHAHFYPVNPGREEECWKRFHDEAYDRFLGGSYGGQYENTLVREFEALLPAEPPWQKHPVNKPARTESRCL